MNCTTTQGFGKNANGSYAAGGLLGHPAIDIECGWGTPIFPEKRIYVYKILTVEHPAHDGTGYTGVFGIDEDGNEWTYGHCDPTAIVGRWYEVTDVIGTEANHGTVFYQGIEITLAMQKAGDKRGNHRHIQKRLCKKVPHMSSKEHYITAQNGGAYRDDNGNYYEIINYDNGYNGCVDWTKPIPMLPVASDQIALLAAKLESQGNTANSKVLFALAAVLRSFGY